MSIWLSRGWGKCQLDRRSVGDAGFHAAVAREAKKRRAISRAITPLESIGAYENRSSLPSNLLAAPIRTSASIVPARFFDSPPDGSNICTGDPVAVAYPPTL